MQIIDNIILPSKKKTGPKPKPYVWGRNNIPRQQAKKQNEIFYDRGIPCGNGHVCLRYVKNNHCVECEKNAKIKHRKITKNEWFTNIKRNYGLTQEDYLSILSKQNYKCAICKTELKTIKPCIDHNHITKKVRGILCSNCNLGIGNLRHNFEFLRTAALYCEET